MMDLNQRIIELLNLELAFGAIHPADFEQVDKVKQLIQDVIKEVTPERLPRKSYVDPHISFNDAIDEMEAKAKKLLGGKDV